jgi:2-C-methyl-D-erythritol 4-phosphate cytidylyltransferase/2-C-methyl-D-erythritol 2,4-cyclodiphosphate synthase
MSESAPTVAVVVVAAGSGARLDAGVPKAFAALSGWSILDHALVRVFAMSEAAQVIVVAPATHLDRARQSLDLHADAGVPMSVVVGGDTRQQSVENGLAALADSVSVVLVHDAARALTPSSQFDRVVAAVRAGADGVVPGLPVADTIKRTDADGGILETVDRSELSVVQTPQGFPRAVIERAYAAAAHEATDDAGLVAAIGLRVKVIAGDEAAFKITTAWDLNRAELLLGPDWDDRATRVGVGVDVHAFSDDPADELWLAGLHWPGERGLRGHSDGDAVCHAIVDAILSAAGLGDIGSVFGTADPRRAGARGVEFIREAVRMLGAPGQAGWRVRNVAVQVIGNRPRVGTRRSEAALELMRVIGAPVSVTATTTDGLGFTGRGEGVTAIATALLVADQGVRPHL